MGIKQSSDSPLHQLQQLVIDQKTKVMPKENLGDADLIDAQVRIEQYDRFVTSTVSQVITGQEVEVVSVMYDPDLDSELSALYERKEGRARQLVEQYLRYKARLDRMLSLAMEVSRERKV